MFIRMRTSMNVNVIIDLGDRTATKHRHFRCKSSLLSWKRVSELQLRNAEAQSLPRECVEIAIILLGSGSSGETRDVVEQSETEPGT